MDTRNRNQSRAANISSPRLRRHGYAAFAAAVPLALAFALTLLTLHHAPPASQSSVEKALPGLSLPFIANAGQYPSQVAYYAHGFAGTAFVTRQGALVLSLPPPARQGRTAAAKGWSLVEVPLATKPFRVTGVGPKVTRVRIFHGREKSTAAATFREVRLGDPWTGVSLAFRARGDRVERVFTVAPEASAAAIRMQIRGATSLSVNGGELVAGTGFGAVRLSHPRAYQRVDGQRREVAVSYVLDGDVYGFRLGPHDRANPVVIDPVIRTTYLGTPKYDDAFAIALGPDGSVYVAGTVWDSGFPGAAGGAQPAYGEDGDGFLSRLSHDLTRLLQSTYLGGSASDQITAIAVAPDTGAVYVTGRTYSSDFPLTAGGAQPTYAGNADAFVTVFNPKLTRIMQSTYLGGTEHDEGWSLVLSPDNGNLYVGGLTASSNFPDTAGAAQAAYGGGASDGFVAELAPNLRSIVRATYVGGSDRDIGFGLAYYPGNSIYLVGGTSSDNFPASAGNRQVPSTVSRSNLPDSAENAFVARLSPGLTRFRSSLVFGGSEGDQAHAIVFAPSQDQNLLYISGNTSSRDFPDTAGGAQPAYGGGKADAFVVVMGAKIYKVLQATYLGGSTREDARMALGFDPGRQTVYIAGMSRSTDLPDTAGGLQPFCRDLKEQGQVCGKGDAFIGAIDASLTQFRQVTHLGGSQHEGGHMLAVDPGTGNLYLAYGAMSDDLLHTQGAPQTYFAGGARDAGVSLLTPDLQPNLPQGSP